LSKVWNLIKFAFFFVCGFFSLQAAKYLYGPWSRMWRAIYRREYKNVEITPPAPWHPSELIKFFADCKWVKDKWYHIDAIASPEKFFATKKGDCDEFAAFSGTVMTTRPGHIMSVTWYAPEADSGEKWAGHNVFLFREGGVWWHIGNWGRLGPYTGTPSEVAEEIARSVGGMALTYSRRTVKDLKYVDGGILITREKSKAWLRKSKE
jgi:hypothetical protein